MPLSSYLSLSNDRPRIIYGREYRSQNKSGDIMNKKKGVLNDRLGNGWGRGGVGLYPVSGLFNIIIIIRRNPTSLERLGYTNGIGVDR